MKVSTRMILLAGAVLGLAVTIVALNVYRASYDVGYRKGYADAKKEVEWYNQGLRKFGVCEWAAVVAEKIECRKP